MLWNGTRGMTKIIICTFLHVHFISPSLMYRRICYTCTCINWLHVLYMYFFYYFSRELLNCESTLASIYCWSALLCLHSLSSSLPFPLHFTLLSQHYFSQPSVEEVCLSTSPSLSRCLLFSTPSLFYSDPCLLERELLSWLWGHSGDVLPLVAKLNEEVSIVGGGNGCG